jgi:hypothetical protein
MLASQLMCSTSSLVIMSSHALNHLQSGKITLSDIKALSGLTYRPI